ncbi:hypothetical protein Gotur_017705, partial [Gossypium turneri]
NWILGYNHSLGSCTHFEVELWGILDGILILLNKGYKWATVQTDYSDVAKALTDKGLEDLGITRNLIVDRLTKLYLDWKSSLQIFDMSPNEVLGALQQDKACGAFEQLI